MPLALLLHDVTLVKQRIKGADAANQLDYNDDSGKQKNDLKSKWFKYDHGNTLSKQFCARNKSNQSKDIILLSDREI